MDSIIFIKIVVVVEEKFESEIPDSELLMAEMNTANKIFKVLKDIEAITYKFSSHKSQSVAFKISEFLPGEYPFSLDIFLAELNNYINSSPGTPTGGRLL